MRENGSSSVGYRGDSSRSQIAGGERFQSTLAATQKLVSIPSPTCSLPPIPFATGQPVEETVELDLGRQPIADLDAVFAPVRGMGSSGWGSIAPPGYIPVAGAAGMGAPRRPLPSNCASAASSLSLAIFCNGVGVERNRARCRSNSIFRADNGVV